MANDTTKYLVGPCSITYDGSTLGYTDDSTEITVSGGMKFVQGSHSPSAEEAFSGREAISIKGNFLQSAELVTILNKVIPHSTLSGSVLKVGRTPGYRASQNAAQIVIHPLEQGAGVTLDWTIYNGLFDSETSLRFAGDTERMIPFNIVGLYDDSRTDGDRLFGIGVSADSSAPTLTSITPADNATEQLATVNIVIVFSEAMSKHTLVDDDGLSVCATVYDETNDEFVACAASVSTTTNANDTLTLNPDSSLTASATIRVVVNESAKDLAGNSFAGAAYEFAVAA